MDWLFDLISRTVTRKRPPSNVPAALSAGSALEGALETERPAEEIVAGFFSSPQADAERRQALLACLTSPRSVVRWGACQVMAQLGPPAPDAVPILVACLEDPARKVRIAAAEALGLLEQDTPEVRKSLEALLAREGKDVDVVRTVRTARRRLSECAREHDAPQPVLWVPLMSGPRLSAPDMLENLLMHRGDLYVMGADAEQQQRLYRLRLQDEAVLDSWSTPPLLRRCLAFEWHEHLVMAPFCAFDLRTETFVCLGDDPDQPGALKVVDEEHRHRAPGPESEIVWKDHRGVPHVIPDLTANAYYQPGDPVAPGHRDAIHARRSSIAARATRCNLRGWLTETAVALRLGIPVRLMDAVRNVWSAEWDRRWLVAVIEVDAQMSPERQVVLVVFPLPG